MVTWGDRGSAAFTAAVGLLLLALAMVACTPTWAGGVHDRQSSAPDVLTPGAEVSTLSTLPLPAVRNPEHLPSVWPVGHKDAAGPETLDLAWPAAGSAAIVGPQQPGHRTAGSRSPPLV
ncbi:hypothetical protein AB0B45_46090 [Nonomuraea sp. NPDC049152]|uniref:hypothetical protein n=1 Tax=Nonomuraea sp. NPDC049152 TaxID=3154350 RepID=UPI00340F58C1